MTLNQMTGAQQVGTRESTRRTHTWSVLRLILGLALISFLVWRTDAAKLGEALLRISPLWLGLAFLVQIVGKIVWALRWSTVLAVLEVPSTFWRLIKAIYVGTFFNNFLPTNFGGDIYRGYWIVDDSKLYGRSLLSIFLERLIGFATLGFIALPAFLLLFWTQLEPPLARFALLAILLALCGSVLLLNPTVFAFLDRIVFRGGRFLAAKRRKVLDSLQIFHGSRAAKWRIYALSIAVHLAGILFFYCIGRGLHLPLEEWHYLVIVPLTVLTSSLPISFNALGVREATLVVLTNALGTQVTPSQAIALGLTSAVVTLAISLIGGVVYVAGKEKSPLYLGN